MVQFLVQKWCSFVKHRGSSATARGVRREERLSRERSRELKSFKLPYVKTPIPRGRLLLQRLKNLIRVIRPIRG